MKVAKWGNSLAIRLPADLVARLGIVEGDDLTSKELEDGVMLTRKMTPDEAIEGLRKFRGRLPEGYKFDREWANSRGSDDEE
jgi:antitoxin MazE